MMPNTKASRQYPAASFQNPHAFGEYFQGTVSKAFLALHVRQKPEVDGPVFCSVFCSEMGNVIGLLSLGAT
jgi:hypothetical protein